MTLPREEKTAMGMGILLCIITCVGISVFPKLGTAGRWIDGVLTACTWALSVCYAAALGSLQSKRLSR